MPNVIRDVVVPPELGTRVSFSAHDLFAPQTVKAQVLLLRWTLHNWSDDNCIRILRAQIPALGTGSRLIIQDTCMPSPGTVSLWKEKDLRSNDIDMAATFNSREREIGEWESLLKTADQRFTLNTITQLDSSALSIIEVIWNGDMADVISQWDYFTFKSSNGSTLRDLT
ncbi:S-adenosyl-L-methionine-dependent methyltransferase [Xylaria sp. FL1042]|nr:S-adenosyl-L-methionine-dependent methyltransferase [Xylaria sp. FL1042]